MDIVSVRGRHVKEIARLEGLAGVDLDVTETKHVDRVLLPAGIRVAHAALGSGQVLWSPPTAEAVVVVEKTTQTVVVHKVVPVLLPVCGDFVRQWGASFKSEV